MVGWYVRQWSSSRNDPASQGHSTAAIKERARKARNRRIAAQKSCSMIFRLRDRVVYRSELDSDEKILVRLAFGFMSPSPTRKASPLGQNDTRLSCHSKWSKGSCRVSSWQCSHGHDYASASPPPKMNGKLKHESLPRAVIRLFPAQLR